MRYARLSLLIAVVLILSASPALAVSIGPYVDLAGGSGEMEWDNGGESWDNLGFTSDTWDVEVGTAAVGFALDTAPLGPAPFNYRLNVGLESQVLEDDYDVQMEMGGVVVENTFGFAIVRRPTLRWWVGPLVRFGFYSGETDTYYRGGDRTKTEAELFEFGVGAATGINIPLGKSRKVILAPSAGVRFIGVGGTGTVKNLDLGTEYEDDLSGGFTTAFVNCALLF